MTLRRWLAIASLAALASSGPVQVADLQLPPTAAAHQQAVVDLFDVSYTAYQSVSSSMQVMMNLTCAVGSMLLVMTTCFRFRRVIVIL